MSRKAASARVLKTRLLVGLGPALVGCFTASLRIAGAFWGWAAIACPTCAAFGTEADGEMDMPPAAAVTRMRFWTLKGSNGTDGAKIRGGIRAKSTGGFS